MQGLGEGWDAMSACMNQTSCMDSALRGRAHASLTGRMNKASKGWLGYGD